MNIEDAIVVLNARDHDRPSRNGPWALQPQGGAGDGDERYLTEFEAIAIAEKYLTLPTPEGSTMFRNLILDRPLAVIDAEATGTDPNTCRIVELFVRVMHPNISEPLDMTWRLNPGVPIDNVHIHGIHDADVAGCPTFREMRGPIWAQLADCDLLGFNLLRYDLPLLQAEFDRAGWPFDLTARRLLDPLPLFQAMPWALWQDRHTLADAVRCFLGRQHDGAHGARSDALAAAEVLDAMLTIAHYPLPRTVPELAERCAAASTEQIRRFQAQHPGRS